MKTYVKYLIAFIAFAIIHNNSKAQCPWKEKANFPGHERTGAVGFNIGNKGYVGMGLLNTPNGPVYYSDFWEYNPDSDKWTKKANLPIASYIDGSTSFSIGNKGFVCSDQMLFEYDPKTDKWVNKKAFFPGNGFGNAQRKGAISFSIGTKGYVGLGYGNNLNNAHGFPTWLNDIWEYDTITNKWKEIAGFPGKAREGATCFSIGSKGYVGMGRTDTSFFRDFYEYDTVNNTWTQKAYLNDSGIYGIGGFSIGNMGYTFVTNIHSSLLHLWKYDTSGNKWTKILDCDSSLKISGSVSFSIGDKGYLTLGMNYGNAALSGNDSFWQFEDTASGIHQVEQNVLDFSIYPIPNAGEFYVNSSVPVQSLEIYDLSGKMIYNNNELPICNTFYLKPDISLSNGIYFIKMISREGMAVKKFTVIK